MIRQVVLIFTFLLLTFSNQVFSAPASMGERILLQSNVLHEERALQILLPENYHNNKQATYPVIYLLDGDFFFHGVSGMLDFLANKGQIIPDVILVGIADKGTDKYRQYMTPEILTAPFKENDQGKAEQFLNFIVKEVKPYIKNNYRTANNNILVGGSIGGLFVVNALLESPESFEHFIAISPSIWLNEQGIMKKAKQVITTSQHRNTALHLALGDEEKQGVFGLVQLLDEAQPKNIDWQFYHYPDENHNTVSLVALRASLKRIFNGWYLSNKTIADSVPPANFIAHYKKLSAALALKQPIPTPSIKSTIRYFYRHDQQNEIAGFMTRIAEELPESEQAFIMMQASYAGHYDSPTAALKILKKAEQRFAHSVEYLKSIAVTYEQLNNKKMVNTYYNKALKQAKMDNNNQWQINIIEAKLVEY